MIASVSRFDRTLRVFTRTSQESNNTVAGCRTSERNERVDRRNGDCNNTKIDRTKKYIFIIGNESSGRLEKIPPVVATDRPPGRSRRRWCGMVVLVVTTTRVIKMMMMMIIIIIIMVKHQHHHNIIIIMIRHYCNKLCCHPHFVNHDHYHVSTKANIRAIMMMTMILIILMILVVPL